MWCCIVLINKKKKVAIVLVLIVEHGKLHFIVTFTNNRIYTVY